MGAHSLPRSSRTDAGRIAGVGVLATLSLAGGAGVASAHGTDPGQDEGDGHLGQTVSRTDTTTDPGGICAVLGGVDLPGLDCSSDGSTSRGAEGDDPGDARSVMPPSTVTPGTDDAASRARSNSTPAPSSTEDRNAASDRNSTGGKSTAQNAAAQNTGQSTASPSPAQPRTTGNPIDAPSRPGTTRTLPIGG